MSEPHKVSEPMNALDYYRKGQMQDAEIARLEAEVERLTRERDEAKATGVQMALVATREVMAQRDEALRAKERAFDCHGGPGTAKPACDACVSCCLRRAQAAEAEVVSLRRLNTEIHEAKDALAKVVRPCACTEFDDGSAFHLGSFAGGAAPGGAYAYVRCVERKADGTEVVHHYVPAPTDV